MATTARMRVLIISFLFPNSVYPNRGVFVLNRLKAVQQYADVKVINPILWFPFCSRLERYKDYHRIPRKEIIEGIEVYHPRFFSIPIVLKIVIAFTYCLAVLPIALKLRKRWRFDLVDLHWTYPDLPAGRVLARLLGVRQLITIRGMAGFLLGQRTFSSWIVRRLLPKSDFVVAVSNRLKDVCITRGVSKEKITTIRNGVNVARFHHLNLETSRKRLGLSLIEQIVLGIGYVTPNKGFDRIVQSFPDVVKQFPHAHLYLIGPNGAFAQGDCSDELMRLIDRLGLKQRIHFVGEVSNLDLVHWYNAADCFCLSSKTEGCPNVLLEAQACGCPVVATDVGSVAEVVVEESMGMVVPNNTEGVRDGLLSVLSQHYDRQAIAANMRQFDWDWCARQVVEVYQRLLCEPHKRSDKSSQKRVVDQLPTV